MKRLLEPWPALGVGLLAFPLAKLLWIPNYVFNFLATLVHECGHALAAWLMGMPSIPSISPAGGGVTVWGEQVFVLALAIWGALGFLAWRFRARRAIAVAFAAAALLYPLLAFTSARPLVATAGGIFLEVAGASACFVAVLALHLERPFERPLYALWGWWMILNRAWESILMLRSPAYWESQRVIDSGLAAGLTSDLETLRAAVGSHEPVLVVVLLLCVAALPAAVLVSWLLKLAADTIDPA